MLKDQIFIKLIFGIILPKLNNMKILIILNEGPYSNEKSYNGLRTGLQLVNQFKDAKVNIYLFSDSIGCVIKNQKPSAAKYNAGELVTDLIGKGVKIKLCKSCLD